MSKKTEVATVEESSTAVVSWEDKLAAYANEAAQEEPVFGGKFLSLKAGRLALDKVPCAGNKLDVIVIASTTEYALYEGAYDANNPQPPICYAFGKDEQTMRPHEKSANPQHDNCFHCPKNQWGSDPKGGRGKACKNTRRLALIAADCIQNPDTIADVEEIYVKLPVMSVTNWAKYINDVKAQFKRPPFAVTTTLSTEPDAKSQFKVTFKAGVRVPDEAIAAIMQRHEKSSETIDFPYAAPKTAEPVKESDKF